MSSLYCKSLWYLHNLQVNLLNAVKFPIYRPVDGDNLDLPENAYLIVDEVLPRLGVITLYQYATLELKDSMDHVLNCSHIFLHGGNYLIN